MTVSNDRSQTGSALENGRIEFLQNRRIPCDDGKGVSEFLNETDSSGHGIRVPATYYMQISNSTQRPSQQRRTQQKNSDPLQFAFTDSGLKLVEGVNPTGKTSYLNFPSALKGELSKYSNLLDLKYVMMPMEKNKIMIRVQNMNDEFDGITDPLAIDMYTIAKVFWGEINTDQDLDSFKVTETSVTGNQEVSKMEARRLKWNTTDKSGPLYSKTKLNDSNQIYPMQIRVFIIEYTPVSA